MNWIYYLLETNLYLTCFYLLYYIALRNETWYHLNRAYLLISSAIAFALPVLQIGALKPVTYGKHVITIIREQGIKNIAVTQAAPFNYQDYVSAAYLMGAITMSLLLLYKLFQLKKLIKKSENQGNGEYRLVIVSDSNMAFSFFNYLFIGEKVIGRDTVIRHELVHIRGKHSFDILFLEFLKIISWFSPIIYLLQISLKTLHEFIADEQTATLENDTIAYSTFLVNSAYGISGPAITHSFFNYNLLKTRIMMLHQQRSGNLARLKYLLALPLCLAMLCLSTLGFTKNYGWLDLAPVKKTPVAISPGDTGKSFKPAKENINTGNVTGKGYRYEETGYLVNHKANFRVIITEKDGKQTEYYRNSATKAQIAMLHSKYGYTFPKMDIFPKLPPPPPQPAGSEISINAPAQKLPPPPPPKNPEISLNAPAKKLPPPPRPPKQPKALEITIDAPAQKIPPPPPPKDPKFTMNEQTAPRSPFDSLYRYVAKYCRYPAKALNNHIAGHGMFTLSINDGRIENLKVQRKIDPAIDGEITRVVNNFPGKLNVQSGRYTLPVTYLIQNAAGNNVGVELAGSKDANNSSASSITLLAEVVVVGFI